MTLAITPLQEGLLTTARALAPRFAERAGQHDRDNTFPEENYQELKAAGYHTLSVPQEYGGQGAGLLDVCLAQEELARGDGATALGIGMHLSLLGRLAEDPGWPPRMWEDVCRRVVSEGVLINSAATEPAMGSPSRGGLPVTTAHRVEGGWQITGRKTFTTLAPVLDLFVVLATVEPEQERGNFLVPRQAPGLRIEPTWDALGMRGTGSHDIVLDGVRVPQDARIVPPADRPPGDGASGRGWAALTLGAVYLGVAHRALDEAAAYTQQRVPSGLGKPISELEGVQEVLGRMDLAIRGARVLLFATAGAWDRDPSLRRSLAPDIAAAKYLATNAAVEVTDLAMRVVGGPALSRSLPFERLFRDARAGLYNPPQDPAALKLLGQWSLGQRPQLT